MSRVSIGIFVIAFLGSQSCGSGKSIHNKLVDKWIMSKVYEYDLDVTDRHNPAGNRWIEFKSDGTFESGGDPFGKNTGRWKVEHGESILYIDSDVDDDDSEWRISIDDDEITWTGIGHPRKENTRLVHKRYRPNNK